MPDIVITHDRCFEVKSYRPLLFGLKKQIFGAVSHYPLRSIYAQCVPSGRGGLRKAPITNGAAATGAEGRGSRFPRPSDIAPLPMLSFLSGQIFAEAKLQ